LAEIISKYETVVIFKSSLGDEATAASVEKFKNIISANCTLDSADEWGKRKLAYPINDETEGFYIQFNFTGDNNFPSELDRQLKISDDVLRSLIIKSGK
jgi:small subunit ribosomal protein S6